ncbi:hypothetical protein EJ02DRAFT_459235 [Clathrospora elynae]|uniref:Cohesin loading factor-domain-containing protein n=1 Tax=Clathrospora elynae TaxID=706981 RepID=A0A6A5SAU2_9PLEO|nr:hypothetical protein EJ02DRAFT_459235 [Clathrospora elynae]
MNPGYNWPPQAYANGQYPQYPPPQQPNGYQQHGYPPQYPQMHMQTSQGYAPSQPQSYQGQPQHGLPRPSTQQYSSMPPNRSQPQVMIPARAPNYATPMQMQPPRIRQVQVQVPVQRTSNVSIAQTDGPGDHHRRHSAQAPPPPTSTSKPVQPLQSHQENGFRPQQRTTSTPAQNHNQHRAPLQPQNTPQQRVPSLSQTPSSQYRRPSVQQPASIKSKSHPEIVIPKSSSHQLTPTKRAHAPTKVLPAELSDLLLSAADEYIAAARGMGALLIRDRREADVRQYYKLMSTALGCMDTVLREFNMPPRDEANLRLRYAALLIEETHIESTDNSSRIEEILSKQISLCGRHRLQGLKFAAFHLQARYQFKTNHRAGLKSLDKPITDAETFGDIAWVYALRFLKLTLALQIPGRVEVVLALQQLHAIQAHAHRREDRAVYVACCALEGMVHLRSGASDRLEQAQRAVAAARSLQLQVSAEQLGSFGTLIDLIDLACRVLSGTPNTQKSNALLEAILGKKVGSGSVENGVFTVLIEHNAKGNSTYDTGGVFRKNADKKDELVFTWLPKEDLKALCFHICALDHHVHEKGLIYMKEAHQRFRETSKRQAFKGVPASVALARIEWNMVLDWHSRFAIGLMACFREDATTADDALSGLKKRVALSPYNNQEAFTRTLAYLSAITDQSNGSLDSALATYSADVLAVPEKGQAATGRTDIAILAALNRLLILRDTAHPQHYLAEMILAQVKPLGEDHANQYIRMAFRLVQAFLSEETAISYQKKGMQAAVGQAQGISQKTQNFQFVSMAMCYFVMRFFADQVGEKSIQAIRAAKAQAKNIRKPLWMAVAAGLCANTYQRNGLAEEAQKALLEWEAIRLRLPLALRGGEEDVDAEGEEDL